MGQAGWRGATSVKHRRLGVPFGPHGRWCTWVAAKRAVIAEQARTRRYLTHHERGIYPAPPHTNTTFTLSRRYSLDQQLRPNGTKGGTTCGPGPSPVNQRIASLRNATQFNATHHKNKGSKTNPGGRQAFTPEQGAERSGGAQVFAAPILILLGLHCRRKHFRHAAHAGVMGGRMNGRTGAGAS